MEYQELTIKLPAELVEEALDFDLLTEQSLVTLLRAEVDRRVMELVNAEIKDYRAEKTAKRDDED